MNTAEIDALEAKWVAAWDAKLADVIEGYLDDLRKAGHTPEQIDAEMARQAPAIAQTRAEKIAEIRFLIVATRYGGAPEEPRRIHVFADQSEATRDLTAQIVARYGASRDSMARLIITAVPVKREGSERTGTALIAYPKDESISSLLRSDLAVSYFDENSPTFVPRTSLGRQL